MSFANTCCSSVGDLFAWLIVTFAGQKILVWCSRFVYFWFCFSCLRRQIKRMLLRVISKRNILPMFSSKGFMVSGLIFETVIHLELIFVNGVKQQSTLLLLHAVGQFSQYHLLRRLSFHYCMFLVPLPCIHCPYKYGLLSGLFILFYWSVWLFLCPRDCFVFPHKF